MPRRLFAALAIASVSVLGAGAALAAVDGMANPAGTVSADPVDFTPHVLDGTVRGIAVVGSTVVVGGDFSTVREATKSKQIARDYLFTYTLATGVVSTVAPTIDGPVYAVAAGANNTVYVAGNFEHVNGASARNLARLDVATGNLVSGFNAGVGAGDIRTVVARGNALYIGGSFASAGGQARVSLAKLDATTGAADVNFNARLEMTEGVKVKVEDLALSPDATKLVAVGSFTKAAGLARKQLVVLDIANQKVADWSTEFYSTACDDVFDTYLRGVEWAPSGSYFVVVTTGALSGPNKPCDTASRFDIAGTGVHDPKWVNHTGGNTLFSVAISDVAIYVGGHQQWMDNPFGRKSKGAGAVSRPGIAALDPTTGHALAWNPTRTRGVGARALVLTSAGLLVGSDTTQLGHEYHARLGMFPAS